MATDHTSEISELRATLASVEAVLDPDAMRKEADSLRERSMDPTLWEDQEKAQEVTRRLSYLDAELARLEALHTRLDDTAVMFELAESEGDEDGNGLDEIVTRLCDERAGADVAQLHAYLEKRAASHVSEARDLELVLHHASPGGCGSVPAPGKASPKKPDQPILFGN